MPVLFGFVVSATSPTQCYITIILPRKHHLEVIYITSRWGLRDWGGAHCRLNEKLNRTRNMRCLELCCGYASFSRVAAEAFGYDAVTADSDPYFSATHTVNILEWDHAAAYPSGHFDVIWASPPCTEYSHARRRGAPRNLAHADAIAQKCLEIIEYHSPRAWAGSSRTRGMAASSRRDPPWPVSHHRCACPTVSMA